MKKIVSGRMGRNNSKRAGLSVYANWFRWGLLVSFVACLLPLPSPSIFETSGFENSSGVENYPCKGNLCGCRNAEQCWTSCCCTTPEERLAWAIENNVTPPAYAILSSSNPSTTEQFPDNETLTANSCSDSLAEPTMSCQPESCQPDVYEATDCPHCASKGKNIVLIESDSYCGKQSHEATKPSEANKGNVDVFVSKQDDDSRSAESLPSKEKSGSKKHKVRFVRVLDKLKCQGISFSVELINHCFIPELRPVTMPMGMSHRVVDFVENPPNVYLSVSLPPPRFQCHC